jgi:alkylation response protein AidB-like acyl-CoA dehydrogenase
MDFGWTAEQRELHARMRAVGIEADGAPQEQRMRILAASGALGLPLPKDAGGCALDLLTTAYAYEGLGATLRDGGLLLAAGAHLFGVALMLARVGTPEQRAAWLPKFASGEAMATIGATEEDAGSDVASVSTLVESAGAGLKITGRKCYVTYADRAAVYFVLARDVDTQGVTGLLVPRDRPGVSVGAPLATAGLASARLAPVELSGVEVGVDAVVGRRGAGRTIFQIAMTFERALILAFRLGAMETALGEAVRFARTREIGGGPIGRHQAVSHRIAHMKLRLETSRLLVYRAAWLLDRGERAQAEAALAKWHLADSALASALDACQLRGGAGFLEPSGLPGAIDDALGATAHSGTQDVLATVVARWLGLGGGSQEPARAAN